MRSTGEYGHFFPPALTPHYYNESDVSDYFPLSSAAARTRGYRWKESPEESDRNSEPVPDHINDVQEDVVGKVFICEFTGRQFKIIKQELDFLKNARLPLPR